MKLSDAINMGYTLYLGGLGYAQPTISTYTDAMLRMCGFLNDPEVTVIDHQNIVLFLAYIENNYKPQRVSHRAGNYSPSSILNHVKAIRRFFDFAMKDKLVTSRPDTYIKMPKSAPAAIYALNETELDILKKFIKGDSHQTIKSPAHQDVLGFPLRLKAIVTLILDIGVTNAELCRAEIGDFDSQNQTLFVRGVTPTSQGSRAKPGRTLNLSKRTCWLIVQYLNIRKNFNPTAPLFAGRGEARLDTNAVRCLFRRLGEKLDINDFSPDTLRDTFAVEFLRSTSGDEINLKQILGVHDSDKIEEFRKIAQVKNLPANGNGSIIQTWFGSK